MCTIAGKKSEYVKMADATVLMGMTIHQFHGLRRRWPECDDLMPLYGSDSHRSLSIYDIFEQTRWVLFSDVCRTLNVNQSTLTSWFRVHKLISTDKRPFRRNALCISYEDVLAMEVRLRVKELVGRGKVTPWAEIDAWVAMGPEAIAAEAARQAIDELGEQEFAELT